MEEKGKYRIKQSVVANFTYLAQHAFACKEHLVSRIMKLKIKLSGHNFRANVSAKLNIKSFKPPYDALMNKVAIGVCHQFFKVDLFEAIKNGHVIAVTENTMYNKVRICNFGKNHQSALQRRNGKLRSFVLKTNETLNNMVPALNTLQVRGHICKCD